VELPPFAGSGVGAGAGVATQEALPFVSVHAEALPVQSVKSAQLPELQFWSMFALQRVWPAVQSDGGATHAPSLQVAPFVHMSLPHLPPSVQYWTTSVRSGWQRVSPAVHSGFGACRHCPSRQNSSSAQSSLPYHCPSGLHARRAVPETHSDAPGVHTALLTHQPLLHTSLPEHIELAYQAPEELHSRKVLSDAHSRAPGVHWRAGAEPPTQLPPLHVFPLEHMVLWFHCPLELQER